LDVKEKSEKNGENDGESSDDEISLGEDSESDFTDDDDEEEDLPLDVLVGGDIAEDDEDDEEFIANVNATVEDEDIAEEGDSEADDENTSTDANTSSVSRGTKRKLTCEDAEVEVSSPKSKK